MVPGPPAAAAAEAFPKPASQASPDTTDSETPGWDLMVCTHQAPQEMLMGAGPRGLSHTSFHREVLPEKASYRVQLGKEPEDISL
jgi:hypothetical protein